MHRGKASILVILLVAATTASGVRAQEAVHVRIQTNYPEAVLYADSVLIGGLSSQPVAVPAKSRTLRLVPQDVDTWSIAPVMQQVDAEAGDTIDVTLDFPYYYRVESIPFDASVLVEDDGRRHVIGETPLLYRASEPLEGHLVISLNGYAVERIKPGRDVWNRHVVSLHPSDDLDPTAAQVNWSPPKRHRAWIDYAALGSALAAGVLAVHYKFRADDLYAEYDDTRDPLLRERIHRFDTRAGVALGAMQVGLGVFAVRLALR